ncbi:MAG: hypothetical protein JXX29_00370 [Deltaproteobacteria bacterium]|nr:hypothetical protein [Deltaproteobacteria bacterium]MBN2670090.1 hypothetical protein [Deltaproteobacteria bacterium]
MNPATLLTILCCAASLGCSGIRTIDTKMEPVLITDLDEMAEEYVKKLNSEGLLVKFDKGDVIPVEVLAELPFANVESGQNQLVFSQTTYVYLCKDGAYVSPDGIHFAAVYDGKAVRKLYGAGQGSFSIGFSMNKEDGAKLITGVSLK